MTVHLHLHQLDKPRAIFDILPGHAAETARTLAAGLNDAIAFHDPNLSDQGNRDESERRVQAAKATAADTATQQRNEAGYERDVVAALIRKHRPVATDSAETQAAWGRALMYLDRGHAITSVLRTADMPLTLAIELNGPDWIRAQSNPATLSSPAYDPADEAIATLRAAVSRRLAEVHPEREVAALIRLEQYAADQIAAAEPWWTHMDRISTGRTDGALSAAAQSRVVSDMARARDAEPETVTA